MKRWTLAQSAAALEGRLHGAPRAAETTWRGVGIDTRTLQPGDLYFALRGERVDGHDFIDRARQRGAVAAVVARPQEDPLPQIVVAESRAALGRLAAAWRRQFTLPLLAITGSNGKTTVKELTAAILRGGDRDGARNGLATVGNLNNDLGLPLTLLRLNSEHRWAAVEMGASRAGEIGGLSRIARPTAALINNAAPAHLAGFGSLRDVARAKGEIFDGLGAEGVAAINADDPHADLWRQCADGRRIIEFGVAAGAQVRADDLTATPFVIHTPLGRVAATPALPGIHNRMNALAAAALALQAGATLAQIRAGLEEATPPPGRLQQRDGLHGARLIDDAYNANPASLAAALAHLGGCDGRRILVLGEMGELGEASQRLHAAAGRQARERGVERLFTLGAAAQSAAEAFGAGATHYTERAQLIADLRAELTADAVALIKGSRSMRMEEVVAGVVQHPSPTAGEGPC